MPSGRRLGAEDDATATPSARKLLYGPQETERLYQDLVRAMGEAEL